MTIMYTPISNEALYILGCLSHAAMKYSPRSRDVTAPFSTDPLPPQYLTPRT